MNDQGKSGNMLPGDLSSAHERIRELEQRAGMYEALYESAPFAYQSLDAEGRILSVNRAWLELLGYRRDEVQGRWVGDFIAPHQCAQFRDRFEQFKAEGRIDGLEYLMRASDGRGVVVSATGRVGRDAAGRFERSYCALRDVSCEKSLTQELEAGKALLDMSQSVARTGGWQRDLETNTTFWTDEHFRLLGYKPGEIPPSQEVFMRHVLPEDRARVEAEQAAVLAEGEEYEVEYRFRRADGEVRDGYSAGRVFRNDGGAPLSIQGIFVDVSERKRAEEQLLRSEERHRSIFESAPVGIYQTTPESGIVTINGAMCGYYGYAGQDELVRDRVGGAQALWADPEKRRRFLDILEAEGRVRDYEVLALRRDGSSFWLATTATLEPDAVDGRMVINGFCQDITAHKAAREELRRHQTLLRHVQRISKVGGWEYDIQTKTVFWTTEAYHIHGLTPKRSHLPIKDVLEHCAAYYSPEDIQRVDEVHDQCEATGEPFDFEVPMTTRLGEEKIIRLAGQRLDGLSGGPKVVGAMMDITEIRRAELLHKALFDSMLEGCALHEIILDDCGRSVDYRFLAVNRAFERIMGFRAAEVVGRTTLEIMPDTERHLIEEYGDVALSGRPKSFTCFSKRLGKHFEVSAFQAAPGQFACIFVDVTERLNGERALREAKEQAEAASEAKSQFLANMSHEIRTPLNGMLGLLQLLGTSRLDGAQKKYVETAIQSGWRLNGLVDDILDISRIEAGKVVLHLVPFDLRDVVGEVCRLVEPSARNKGIDISLYVAPEIPNRVMGDVSRLRQVLNSLVGNALKFTDTGSVCVECHPLPVVKPGTSRVLFSIADTGIGIADDKLETLFDAFTQAESSYTRNYQGAGLGLYISQRLVKLMGGNMAVASEQGVGTTLHFCSPFGIADQDHAAPLSAAAPREEPEAASPLRVLLAEDDKDGQFFISELLRREGHEVVVADNGLKALEAMRAREFDLVLMDIQMPEMNGMDATRAIRSSAEFNAMSAIPIIALTAYAMSGDEEVFLAEGMDDYLAKPVGKDELLAMLEKHCPQGRE